MVLLSSKALFACVHASALLVGSSFLPASLAKDMDAAILHQHEEALRAIVDNPQTSTFTAAASSAGAAVSGGNLKAIDINRSLSGDDLTIGNHNNGIGQDRFHLVSNFEGGSHPNGIHDLMLGRRVALSKDGSTAAIAGVLLDNTNDMFRWIVKIFKKDSGTGEWDTSNPIEVIEEESSESIFESDAYVEIALSGDGSVIFIANTKVKRFEGDNQEQGTISKYSIASSASLVTSWSFGVTPDSSTAVGYYFAGLQVATTDDANTVVIGIPYAQKVELIDSTRTHPTLQGTTNSLLGSCVAISKDGNTISASAPGDNKIYIARYVNASWTYEEIPGTDAGITTAGDLGSSLAINEDGTIIAIGSKNHDADEGIDKGSVTVMIKSGNEWKQLGQTLKGERGEGNSSGNYYVGDQFGESIALSDTNAYNGNSPSNTIKIVIGAPKNDPDGISSSDYYNGHVEVYEIIPQEGNTFSQIAYDIDGGTSGEKSGTSVAIDSEGKSILIGSPGFEASSVGGYFEGVAKMYEQTEYSAFPSVVPSSVPSVTMNPSSEPSLSSVPSSSPSITMVPSSEPSFSSVPSLSPSITMNPSTVPSTTVEPSVRPSESMFPSVSPSDSSAPSSSPSITLNPSSVPSTTVEPSVRPSESMFPSVFPSDSSAPSSSPSITMKPSSLPSAEVDKEFQIISTFGPFGTDTEKDWCLTAFDNTGTSKLHVRPCRSYDSRNENLQVWKFTDSGELTLAGMASGEFCVESIFRQIQLGSSCDANDASMINFSFVNGSIVQTKNSKAWKLGFDPESRFERVRLYRDGTLNDVLDKWELRYSYQFPSASPSESTAPLSISTEMRHVCALFSNEVQCIGQNNYGERGLDPGSTEDLNYPNTLSVSSSSSSVKKVVAGYYMTCMLMTNGSVYCNGYNSNEQLGDGTTNDSYSPVQVQKDGNFLAGVTDISEAWFHICAIYGTDDKIYCWGLNNLGQLGFNGTPDAKTIVCTNTATCIVTKSNPRQVECKGDPSWWNNKTFDMGQEITKLTAGTNHVCALLEDQTAKCFGGNGDGELGNGSTTHSFDSAYNVMQDSTTTLQGITDINAGAISTCLMVNSIPMCFGYNGSNNLGIANRNDVLYPTELGVTFPAGVEVVSVHVNSSNGYAVMSDDSVYSWGYKASGGLGQGEATDVAQYVGETDGEPAVKVAFGEWGS